MSWIDIAIIVLVVLCGLMGLLRGLKKSLLSLGAFVIAFLLAFFLSNVIAEALLGIDAIRGFVLGNSAPGAAEISLANIIYGGRGGDKAVTTAFLDSNFFAPITEIIAKSNVDIQPAQGEAMYMAFLMFSAICGVGLFLIIRFLLMIVTAIIKSYIGKKKSIGSRLFGFLISAVQGAVIAFAVTIIFANFGGLTFVPAINMIENEYESPNAVLATPMYQGAYAMRNGLLLPNEEMYGRIVNLVIKKEYENPDTEKLTGERLNMFIDINNLNFENDPWTVDETTRRRKFDEETAIARKASEFTNIGYDNVVQAILDYNTRAAGIVDDTEQLKLSDAEFKSYRAFVTALDGDFDKLIDYLRAYKQEYKTFANDEDPNKIEEHNLDLGTSYQRINDKLDDISKRYEQLEELFGDGPDLKPLIPARVNAGEGYVEDPPEQEEENKGGDEENENGDEENKGGDEENKGGDEENENGDEENKGGDEENKGGDEENKGGDEENKGGDEENENGDEENKGGDEGEDNNV